MLRPSNHLNHIFLYKEYVDMRKSINGLSLLVENALDQDPFSDKLFVFCNKKRDKIKMLYWERNGFVLWYKRLEKQRFKWPKQFSDDVVTLSGQEINWLLDGIDLSKLTPHQKLNYQTIS